MKTVIALFLGISLALSAGAGKAVAQSGEGSDAEIRDEDVTVEERATITLDDLFVQLKRERSKAGARRISQQIWQLWNDSGSDTINLLMGWSNEAIRKKDYGAARDLLAQVIALRPDYPEAWNRRATVFFLTGDYGRSLSDIERTLQLEPRHFGALSGLAAILQKSSLERSALDTWHKVLDLYPANENAQKSVIELEEKLAGEST